MSLRSMYIRQIKTGISNPILEAVGLGLKKPQKKQEANLSGAPVSNENVAGNVEQPTNGIFRAGLLTMLKTKKEALKNTKNNTMASVSEQEGKVFLG